MTRRARYIFEDWRDLGQAELAILSVQHQAVSWVEFANGRRYEDPAEVTASAEMVVRVLDLNSGEIGVISFPRILGYRMLDESALREFWEDRKAAGVRARHHKLADSPYLRELNHGDHPGTRLRTYMITSFCECLEIAVEAEFDYLPKMEVIPAQPPAPATHLKEVERLSRASDDMVGQLDKADLVRYHRLAMLVGRPDGSMRESWTPIPDDPAVVQALTHAMTMLSEQRASDVEDD